MDGFAIYVHWPFCAAKCPYCDFNSHVRDRIDEAAWARLICSELQSVADLPGAQREVQTVFFGGGTPSLMSAKAVGSILDRIASIWPMAAKPEIALEANPNSVEQTRFAGYLHAGVNRVSIGVQSFDDSALARLGRLHDAREARAAIDLALSMFPRVSFDLIYARPGQTVSGWEHELKQALAFGTEHLSLYQLTIEPGTAYASLFRQGKLVIPDEDLAAEQYELTQDICDGAGLPAYEVSNHARPGSESRHNLIYWRYGDYAGVGPGAHGRLTVQGRRLAMESERLPERWASGMSTGSRGFSLSDIPHAEAAREQLLMNLRISEGLDLSDFVARWGVVPAPAALRELEQNRLIKVRGNRLTVSKSGRLLLNRITEQLAGALQKPERGNAFGAGSRTENPSLPTSSTASPRSAEPSA